VPILVTPAFINFCAVSKSRMPPLAFICILFCVTDFNSSTSSNVAPAVPNPVDVFTKSAPALQN
jgi:hypothetical protein